MNTVKIKPVKGRKVRKPDLTYLAEKGESVQLDSYWQRRINQGDVQLIDDKKGEK